MKKLYLLLLIPIYAFIMWLTSASLNPLLNEGATFVSFIIISIVIILFFIFNKGFFADYKLDKNNGKVIRIYGGQKKKIWPWVVIAIAPIVFYILIGIFTTPLFASAKYRNQFGNPDQRKFTTDVQPIDISQLPIVDKDLAYKLADKKMGQKPSLGSMATLGEPTIQRVDGKLMWVVPLQHTGFFKWLNNRSGTPGYITVSAVNQNDVQYVENFNLKYQPGAYFNDNLTRHARFSGGIFKGLTDYSFEIDDTGHPFWVLSTYKNTLGLSLPEATGIMLIDAVNGKTEIYNMDNIPAWIDRVQPESFIMTQIENNGKYIHGVFNFSNKDKYETSGANIIVYYNNKCYLMTGLTSVGTDESAIGFMLVDMVTKESIRYQMSGSTEYAAQKSAEGKVQHLKYVATFPLIINVRNTPTYFMTLKDNEGLIKQFAFVSVADYNIVGTAETISNAMKNYEYILQNNSTGNISGETAKPVDLTGTIERISSEINGQYTVYKFIIKEKSNKIYIANSDLSDELALTREGDSVKITYTESDKGSISITKFDNLAYNQG